MMCRGLTVGGRTVRHRDDRVLGRRGRRVCADWLCWTTVNTTRTRPLADGEAEQLQRRDSNAPKSRPPEPHQMQDGEFKVARLTLRRVPMSHLVTHLTAVDLSMFNSEAYQLIDTLLFRLAELEKLSGYWKAANRKAKRSLHISTPQARQAFDSGLRRLGQVQGKAFDGIEAFLAAWARLSLLFFPASQNSKSTNRGTVLRKVWLVNSRTSPLADRGLRNAWMHFDERLDRAIESHTLGNRQEFTTAAKGPVAVGRSVRVVEMDTLVVRYRDEGGRSHKTDLRALGHYLHGLASQFQKTQHRFRALTGLA